MLWTARSSFYASLPVWKSEVCRWVDSVSIASVDENRETPSAKSYKDPDLTTGGWAEWQYILNVTVDDRLTDSAKGPIREIMALRRGTMPVHRMGHQPSIAENASFRLSYTAIWNWLHYATISEGEYPEMLNRRYNSLSKAKRAVPSVLRRILKSELESEEDVVDLNSCHEICLLDEDSLMAAQYDSAIDEDSMLGLRILYLDEVDSVKVVVWVERDSASADS